MNREVEIKPDMVFGMLTTIKPLTGSKGGAQWFCQCECGNKVVANESALKNHRMTSCGCKRTKVPALLGKQFGRLLVLYRTVDNPDGKTQWVCLCECGNGYPATVRTLMHGSEVPSCGCYKSEVAAQKATKHGLVGTPLHRIWTHMRDRCNNPGDKRYFDYGGRGITVCERWNDRETGLEAFVADMGSTYKSGLQLDRIDNDGPYSPDNCHWVTSKENNRNRRSTLMVDSIYGEIPLGEFVEKSGIPYHEVYGRLRTADYPGVFLTLKDKRGLGKYKPIFEGDGVWLDDADMKKLNSAIAEVESQIKEGQIP